MSYAADTAAGTGASGSSALTLERSGISFRSSRREAPVDPRFDWGLVGVLAVTVLLPGVVVALGLPSKFELIGDLSVFLLLVWSLYLFWRSGRPLTVPYLVCAFVVVMAIGAVLAGDVPRMVVAAKNFLLLPALALVLAALGTSEQRNRVAVITVVGLVCVQFLVMLGQGIADVGVDLVTGTFGDFAGASTGFALEVATCLALGLYARSGRVVWLVLAFVLPFASVWSAIRLLPIVLPFAGTAVAVAAWWAHRGGVGAARRPLMVGVTTLAATLAVFGSYAAFRPSDFNLFTDADALSTYAENAETETTPVGDLPATEAQREAVPGRKVQAETAMRLVNDGPVTLIFGQGLGSTTYAENLGIEEPEDRDYVVVGYMDAGTLLVEVGWLGVALVAASALAIGLAAIGAARRAQSSSWTLALLVAYPGVLISMAAGLVHGNPIRNIGSATIFWVLTGLVLAFVLNREREAPSGSTRPSA